MNKHYILTLSCRDVRGIVAAVTGFLAEQFGNIVESAQFGDSSTGTFFMRVEFALEKKAPPIEAFKKKFSGDIAKRFAMDWQIVAKAEKNRVLIMVSKAGHCLNDLLHRQATGQLAIEIPAIVSNHKDWEHAAKWYGIAFHYLPVKESAELRVLSAEKRKLGTQHSARSTSKAQQEAALLELINRHRIDTVVLARYMQILSPSLCRKLAGKAINIHHSFLPSFKGAKPYHQAFDRGVKIIGATAHYVTDDLDEGPIIEQEVARVDHAPQPQDLAAIGRDIECLVLARALKLHIERRVLLNGKKTVVFR